MIRGLSALALVLTKRNAESGDENGLSCAFFL